MKTSEISQNWDYLLENGIATQAELELVTCINGYSIDTLLAVLDARTGYKSFDQIDESEDEEGEE
jgi:hypothetical protein